MPDKRPDLSNLASALEQVSRAYDNLTRISPETTESIAKAVARAYSFNAEQLRLTMERIAQLSLPRLAFDEKLIEQFAQMSKPLIDPDLFKKLSIAYAPDRTLFDVISAASGQPPLESVLGSAYEAIRASRDYLSEDQEYLLDKIDPEILTPTSVSKAPEKKWSLSNVLTLLSILVSLTIWILQSLPDKQLDKLIEQNETIIEQNETQIWQKSREIELLQQISEAQQQLLDFIEENQDAFVELDDGVVDPEQPVQVDNDLVDTPVDDPESVPDESNQEDDADPENG